MNKKNTIYYKLMGLTFLLVLVVSFAFPPQIVFAEEEKEICTQEELKQYVAESVANGVSELNIIYSGEDYANMKSWFKEFFSYDNLVTKGEYAFYNYAGAKFTYWSYSDYKKVRVTISYKQTAEEKEIVDNFVLNKIETDDIRSMSPYDAMRYVTDFLSKELDYQSGENRCIDVINTKQSNCYGFTMLFQLFMDELDIPCRTVYGNMGIEHIWNVVQLDGQWYHIDVTWDKTYDTYFLISTEQISKTHTITGHFIPECPSNYVVTEENSSSETLGVIFPKKRIFIDLNRPLKMIQTSRRDD